MKNILRFSTDRERHMHPILSRIKDLCLHLLVLFSILCFLASVGTIEQDFAITQALAYMAVGTAIFGIVTKANARA